MIRRSYVISGFLLLAAMLASWSCGDSLNCKEARTCLVKDGERCNSDEDCASGNCDKVTLPYSVYTGEPICREKPSCTLDGCNVCARLGELGRTDGPKDKEVCIDSCLSGDDSSLSCSLCGCPADAKCDAKTDRCVGTLPPLLDEGSLCKKDADCANHNCRAAKDADGTTHHLCATVNESPCDMSPCYGGTCTGGGDFYTRDVCFAACASDADCPSNNGDSFACVKLATGAHQCRLTCAAKNCGGVDGIMEMACSDEEDADGSKVSICPGQP